MAPTEGRVTKPERRWGCHRGTLKYTYEVPMTLEWPWDSPWLNLVQVVSTKVDVGRVLDHVGGW